ncbi:MAG: hypothetical protein JSR46_09365, partial [Verrucomicrobia bacterium]|nr:hypothetical protein [Verrucomicrobiota bacterium]
MKNVIVIFFLFLLSSCATKMPLSDDPDIAKLQTQVEGRKLASINIIDRNGLSETIGAKERVKTYENIDFLSSQSYQKVLRIFSRDSTGKTFAVITSYHPSGQIKQYLEVVNGRANGTYLEWHQNGEKKLKTEVLGGNADLDEKSQSGWTFDSTSYCWNESGALVAQIQYEKGQLVGCAKYFHADGSLAEQVPYEKGEIHGEMVTFDTDGTVLEKTSFSSGLKEGPSVGFWGLDKAAWNEVWHEDLLQEGSYYDRSGSLVSQVIEGNGQRSIFSDTSLSEQHEYRQGKEEGQVLIFNEQQQLVQTVHVKDGMKHGEEIYYWTA